MSTGSSPDREQLFAAHRLELVRLAMMWLGNIDSAEDAVQDVFVALDTTRIGNSPSSYLRAAVVNRARSQIRRGIVARRWLERQSPPATLDQSPPPLTDHDIVAAIRDLPTRQRDVVILRYFLDWSVERTADVLGVNAEAVRSSAYKALRTLRTRIGDFNDPH
ncbi:sigma-70 family RNA polymerase sigma factor [Nakamurella sp. A5-74]|uniref:Sigma-70 family RNA polymerase sigma factor n=1 Tax=Nakamurella sp. A5-74 TaxID=3158264 RepID=A0AAU8DSN6_9ACTN